MSNSNSSSSSSNLALLVAAAAKPGEHRPMRLAAGPSTSTSSTSHQQQQKSARAPLGDITAAAAAGMAHRGRKAMAATNAALKAPRSTVSSTTCGKENSISDFWAEPIAKLPYIPLPQPEHKPAAAPAGAPALRNRAPLTTISHNTTSTGTFKDLRHQLPKPSDVFSDLEESPMALDHSGLAACTAANVSMESIVFDNDDGKSCSSSSLVEETPVASPAPSSSSSSSLLLSASAERRMFMSDVYLNNIYTHLKEQEVKFAPKWNYMTKQPDISFPMRAILVDWLVEVGEEYKLQQETLYLAVNYIDRFLSIMSVQRAKLQLVGTACMFIAAKYEEIYPPDVAEFVYITDDTYSKKHVLRMEQLVLSALRFDLAAPSTLLFTNLFCQLSGCDERTTALAQYLSEITLLEGEQFLKYVPSEIAAACVAVARHTLSCLDVWPEACADYAELSVADFREVAALVHRAHAAMPEHAQQAIRDKYKSERFHSVANLDSVPTSFL